MCQPLLRVFPQQNLKFYREIQDLEFKNSAVFWEIVKTRQNCIHHFNSNTWLK